MKTDVRNIEGNWDSGISLDKHTVRSVPIGHMQFDTERTEIGEALHQLKYRDDWSKIEPLSEILHKTAFSYFKDIQLIIPTPPSRKRERQPVFELCKGLAKMAKLESFENILNKIQREANGKQLRDMTDKESKVQALNGRISIIDGISGDGKYNALLVDDLFDTGASLEASCSALRKYSKIGKIYVATLTWK